ncbi:MAG: hypothetical protein C0605_07145 [Hyphomicrobiales bacterium]|nr:MAG: hypothetical protein C0605_07145 [Hyphomicrobiales bacterium]
MFLIDNVMLPTGLIKDVNAFLGSVIATNLATGIVLTAIFAIGRGPCCPRVTSIYFTHFFLLLILKIDWAGYI